MKNDLSMLSSMFSFLLDMKSFSSSMLSSNFFSFIQASIEKNISMSSFKIEFDDFAFTSMSFFKIAFDDFTSRFIFRIDSSSMSTLEKTFQITELSDIFNEDDQFSFVMIHFELQQKVLFDDE